MTKRYQYIELEQVVYFGGSSETDEIIDEFIDKYIELIESFGWTCGGSFHPMTEEQMKEKYETETDDSDIEST